MEKYRVTLFITIVITVWILYYVFFLPKFTRNYSPVAQPSPNSAPYTPTKQEQKPEIFDKSISLKSEYLDLELFLSERSIKFDSILPKFQDTKKNAYKLIEDGILKLTIDKNQTRIQSVNIKENDLYIEFEPINKVTPSISCNISDDYIFGCNILFENGSDSIVDFQTNINISGTIYSEANNNSDIELIYGYFFKDVNFKFKNSYNPKDFAFDRGNDKRLKWIGLKNKYFIFAIIWGAESYIANVKYTQTGTTTTKVTGIFENISQKLTLQPKSSIAIPIKIYFGPKQKEFLTKYKNLNLDVLYNFGFFDSISKFLFLILTFLYDIFGNYGVAIIFLTLIVRICLFPISVLHQRSIQKLQAVQPLIEKIKEKFKDNKEKMQKEFKKLYEKYRINPIMGCLPLFIQIPILFGLFNLFDRAIELRSAKCFLWITDLSRPDRAIYLKRTILGDNFLHILPILNIIVWITQIILAKNTSMTNTNPGNEQGMKFLMYLMPIIFGFALYNAPSGLNLYWLFTTTFSIFESYVVKKIVKKDALIINE